MKILVIDDDKKHLDSAVATLAGHDVTLCSSYDEAVGLLRERALNKKGEPCYPGDEDATKIPYWDVVLCDLLMPVGERTHGQSQQRYVGEEMPFGWSLGLTAAMRGAKYVAVASDVNHHDHPGSAMLDELNEHIFRMDGAKVLMTNKISFVIPTEEVCAKCNYHCKTLCATNGCCKSINGKDWGKILDRLINAN